MYTCTVTEIVFEVTRAGDGTYCAECLTEDIYTQAESPECVRANVREAVTAFFRGERAPERIRLRFIHDEVLAV